MTSKIYDHALPLTMIAGSIDEALHKVGSTVPLVHQTDLLQVDFDTARAMFAVGAEVWFSSVLPTDDRYYAQVTDLFEDVERYDHFKQFMTFYVKGQP